MPFIKVYVHFVWGTKNREPLLDNKDVRLKVWNHIRENAQEKGIFIDFINGHADHCHCLISLGADQTIQKVMQLIKGESSFWINKHQLISSRFEWQDEYYAVSVSESMLDKVREYIKKQEEHHTRKTFMEECEELILRHGFVKIRDN
ncbi:IS200/IS605 family transposase [Rufibacter roseus]|uniref:IS200/IS605 family transposase n=1 Tax=Rufibacter roseus TaxID=1567108 RepID=A0ABW2DHH7_9BACT|nr:IS200/IS605 family transposase [Rufibacter roseus]